ncbi:MAG: hypothetical protein HN348_08905 [Proteobacteria bacterium]|nr:hypothetical protein [Pseudomonadota bacterium]
MNCLFSALILAIAIARAQNPEEEEPLLEDDDLEFDLPEAIPDDAEENGGEDKAFQFDVDEDDDSMEDFSNVPSPTSAPSPSAHNVTSPAAQGPLTLDFVGKQPLDDNYPLQIIATERDAVVIELPVLVARSRVGVTDGFQLIGIVFVGEDKVTEIRQMFLPQSIAEFGPTVAFLKALVPVNEAKGQVAIVVKQAALDGSGTKMLFARGTHYSLN